MKGTLLFIDVVKTTPYTLGLQALSLAALTVSPVVVLGPSSSFYDQVSAVSPDGLTFYSTIQKDGGAIDPFLPSNECQPACAAGSTCCVDPTPNSTAACFTVGTEGCSKINKGRRFYGETVAVALSTTADGGPAGSIKAQMNTSTCFKLAVVGPDELLCAAGSRTGEIGVHRIDLKAMTTALVGNFNKDCDGTFNEAAAYDPKMGVFYAYLGSGSTSRKTLDSQSPPQRPRWMSAKTDVGRAAITSRDGTDHPDACPEAVYAMDTKTGASLGSMRWDPSLLVMDFEIDPATGEAYGAVQHLDSPPPNTVWAKGLVKLNLTAASSGGGGGGTVPWTKISSDVFGKQVGGKCVKGSSPGAAKHCYYQLNNAAFGEGTFFLNAFETPASGETVIATEATTGKVLFEHNPLAHGVIVDMAYTKWEAPKP